MEPKPSHTPYVCNRLRLVALALAIGLGAALLLAAVAAASTAHQQVTYVEPDTLPSETGGTLTIYGNAFTSATVARLIGFGLLETTFVNDTWLTAAVPPGVAPGTYDVQVTDGITSSTLPAALTIVAPTPVPTTPPQPAPTPLPTPRPTPVPGRPVLTIRNYAVEPSRVVVGREFLVRIEVYNTGSRAGENTLVTFPGGTFIPVGETGHLLWQLHINHTAVVTQRMRVPGNLSSGTYDLQVDMSANDWEGNHYEYPETVAVEVIGVGHGRPQMVIEAARTAPAVVRPGDAFSLTLQVANRGDRTATDVLVGLAAADLAVPESGSNAVALEPVGIDQTRTLTLPLVLGEVTEAGRLNLELALEYSDYQGGSYSARQSVGLEVETTLADRPQLLIAGYRTEPDLLSPGAILTLTLALENVGGGDAERVTLSLGGENGSDMGPFAPYAAGNVRFVATISAGESARLQVQLVVDGSADPGAYNLPIQLDYDDTRGTRHSDSQRISLLVYRRPHFQIGFYRPVGIAPLGVPFELPVEVINVGRTLVNVSTLELASEQLEIEDGSIYLGPIDGGTSGSLEAMAVAQKGGTAEILVTVHYLDDFNQPQVVVETLTVEVEQPVEVPPEAEAPPEREQEQTFWDGVVRFLRGLLGLGS
jgi:hypothetical protein